MDGLACTKRHPRFLPFCQISLILASHIHQLLLQRDVDALLLLDARK